MGWFIVLWDIPLHFALRVRNIGGPKVNEMVTTSGYLRNKTLYDLEYLKKTAKNSRIVAVRSSCDVIKTLNIPSPNYLIISHLS